MICDYFRVTGAHDTVLGYADLFSVTLRDDNIQEFDSGFAPRGTAPRRRWGACNSWWQPSTQGRRRDSRRSRPTSMRWRPRSWHWREIFNEMFSEMMRAAILISMLPPRPPTRADPAGRQVRGLQDHQRQQSRPSWRPRAQEQWCHGVRRGPPVNWSRGSLGARRQLAMSTRWTAKAVCSDAADRATPAPAKGRKKDGGKAGKAGGKVAGNKEKGEETVTALSGYQYGAPQEVQYAVAPTVTKKKRGACCWRPSRIALTSLLSVLTGFRCDQPFSEKWNSTCVWLSSTESIILNRWVQKKNDLQVLPGYWSQWFRRELFRSIYSCSSKWWYSGIRYEMGWNSIIHDEDSIGWRPGKFVHIKNTWIWSTQNRIGIVRHGDSSEDIHALIIKKLKTMVKREHRSETSDYETSTPEMRGLKQERWLRIAGDQRGVERGQGVCISMESKKGSVREETRCSFRARQWWACKINTKNHSILWATNTNNTKRYKCIEETEPQRPESIWEIRNREPCKDYLKRYLHQITLVTIDIFPNVSSINLNRVVNSVISARLQHRQVEGQPRGELGEDGDKSAWAMLKDARQLGSVFQDTEPPESVPSLRKSTKVLGSIRRVQFIKVTQRHADIRENKGPSLGKIQVKVPRERSPYAWKFEDKSQEETEKQERCVRGDAWRLAKNFLKLKEKDKATLLLPYQRMVSPSAIRNKTGGKRSRCRFRSINAHAEQERSDFSRIRNRKGLQKSDDGCYKPTAKCKQKKKRPCMSKNWIYSWQSFSRRYTGRSLTRKTLRRSRVFLRVDQWTTHQRW